MATFPEDMSIAIDELVSAIAEMESRLESAHAERDEAKARQIELELENAGLRRELALARDRQGASADILRTIASTSGDADHALHQIAEATMRLFGAPSATIHIAEGVGWSKIIRFGDSSKRVGAGVPESQLKIGGRNMPGTIVAENRQVHVPDLDNVDADIADWPGLPHVRAAGTKSMSGSPLRLEGKAIGALIVYRDRLLPFTEEELALQQSFADQAAIAIENTRLFNETREALERQTATAEILKVIARSPSDVQPVFEAIASSAKTLLDAFSTTVLRFIGDELHLVAYTPTDPKADEALQSSFPRRLAEFPTFALVRNGETIQFPDTEADDVPPANKELGRLRGFRSVLFTPLMNQGTPVGIISVTRAEPGAFAPHHVQLLQTFADQALIAIENTRLFNETKEALERQTATADILNVIASSPSDVQPVFEAIVESAKRLLGGFSSAVFRFIDDVAYLQAITPTNPAADEIMRNSFPRPVADFESFAMVQGGTIVQISDTEALLSDIRDIARARGFRSMLLTPLMSGGTPIGMISVTRVQTGTFPAHHELLLQTFADQAVIAIENTRLFNETKEALERQTATAEILKVIASSPSDVQPVFDAIAHSAKRLIGGFSTAVHRVIDDIDHLVAFTPTNPESDEVLKAAFPRHRNEMPAIISLVENGETAQIADSEAADEKIRKLALARGWRSASYTPLMNRDTFIGFIVCTRRETGMLADHHVQLLRTFADQAVIAIENARLFNETQEALERQTATADILKVIASSPSNVQPVFDAIAASTKRLIGGHSTAVWRLIDDAVHLVAFTPVSPEVDADLRASSPFPLTELTARGLDLIGEGKPLHVPDTELSDSRREVGRARGYRSQVLVPLMHNGRPIGLITGTRAEPGAFADHHVQLLQTFADQAVIAIENTRLFNETREALERQTATADVLKVIASSPSDVQPVFDAIAHSANRLIGGFSAAVFRYSDGRIHLAAFTPTDAQGDAVLQSSFPAPLAEFPPYQLTRDGAPVELPDTDLEPAARDIARARGYRSMLFAPLMNDGAAIGIITVTRVTPGPFGEQHTRLLQMFADQAVIAIKNVGLFNEVQQRTNDLSESLRQQTAVGDVLKTISRSTFDLQPVLDTLVNSAAQLCDADMAFIMRRVGDEYRAGAAVGYTEAYIDFLTNHPLPVDRGTVTGRAVLDRRPVQIADVVADPEYTLHETTTLAGQRTTLGVPLLRENEPIGVIVLARKRVEPFAQKQIDLVATFADQAVIAIENVRLFNEVQQRTRDLSEALTYQTGSANILRVIASSPTDVGPVLDAIVESACELCDANDAIVYLKEDDHLSYKAHHGPIPVIFGEKRAINRDYVAGRSVVDKMPIHVGDVFSEDGVEFPEARDLSRSEGIRSILSAPLLRENESIGAILLRRTEVHPFTDKQISLLQTFADQAVIAIGNVRLFEEVQAKTRDLEESLQQQTATADVLRVISASPGELEPVFQAMLENAVRLCEAKFAMMRLLEGDQFRAVGTWNLPPAYGEFLAQTPIRVDPKLPLGRVVDTKQPVHVHDVLQHEAYLERYPGMIALAEIGGARTLLQVPMLKEDQLVGTIGLYRQEVRPFTEKQITLVQNFAAQAVIAIENARLLNELRQRTNDLSKSLDDLRTAQDRLVQTEKLASLGQLTAGIAHEIKNPLNFVNNFAAVSAELIEELNDVLKPTELAETVRAEVDELRGLLKDNLEKVVQHGKRADSIVKNMLLHSREGGGEHRPSDINALIDESLNLAYHGARAEKPGFNVTLDRDFDPAAGQIDLFPQEITRVFLNLVSNGFYAVTKRRKESVEPGFEPTLRASTKNLGDAVEICIRDNGTGITPEVKEKMFNPFFTTKPAGEGTGLGLSMSHDIIVKQHGGTIDVDTEQGHFTEFRIVLPRASNFAEKPRG